MPLCFRISCQSVPQCITNFGSGALGGTGGDQHERLREPIAHPAGLRWSPRRGDFDDGAYEHGCIRQRPGDPVCRQPHFYADRAIFDEEIEKIWKKVWLVTVHESELPEPLDFRTITVAREPIVIVRGSDNKIRAFLNVCPHRGNLILRQPSGSLTVAEPSGNANHMTCMFHAWQFDCFGRCVDIPRAKAGYQDRLKKEDVALKELPCEVAHGGFVWLSLNPSCGALSDYIGSAFDIMKEELDTEPLTIFHYHKAIIPSNYKLWHDTNSEFYHDYMHYFNRGPACCRRDISTESTLRFQMGTPPSAPWK